MVDRRDDVDEILRLKARYCRAIDTKDWPLLASCYTPDTRIDLSREEALGGFREPIVGVEAVVASMRDALGEGMSIHVTFLPDIEIVDDHHATGMWGLEYRTWQPPGSPIPVLHGYAYSHDEYRRVDGCWLVHDVRVEVLWSDPPQLVPPR